VSSNRLLQLPMQITELTSLRVLNLRLNKLVELPSGIQYSVKPAWQTVRLELCNICRCNTVKLLSIYDRRSFRVWAPTVWNALPSQLCSSSIGCGQFRPGLKTHLFTQTPLRTFVEEYCFTFTFMCRWSMVPATAIIKFQGCNQMNKLILLVYNVEQ